MNINFQGNCRRCSFMGLIGSSSLTIRFILSLWPLLRGSLLHLELARIGSQLFVFGSSTCDQTAASPLFETFATRLSAQPLSTSSVGLELPTGNTLRLNRPQRHQPKGGFRC